MVEFFEICFTIVNFPFTLALLLILLYWGFFILGAVGVDALDLDVDIDADVDLDLDLPTDVDAGGFDGGGADADIDADLSHSGFGSLMLPMLRHFNAGQVPLMIWLTFLVGFMWAGAVLGTYYFNPTMGVVFAGLMLIPNLIISLYLTKIATIPLRLLFQKAKQGVATPIKIVGKTCTVTSGLVTTKSGQAEIAREGSPLTLSVRCKEGQMKKGTEAVVVDYNDEKNVYTVVPLNFEVPE